jgi:hypothetical protein
MILNHLLRELLDFRILGLLLSKLTQFDLALVHRE